MVLLLPIIRNVSIRPMRVYVRRSPDSDLHRERGGHDDTTDKQKEHNTHIPETDTDLYDIRVRLVRIAADALPPGVAKVATDMNKPHDPSPPAPLKSEASEGDVAAGGDTGVIEGGGVATSLFSFGGSLLRPFYGSHATAKQEEKAPDVKGATTGSITHAVNQPLDSPIPIEDTATVAEQQPKAVSESISDKKSSADVAPADRISQRLASLRKPHP